MHREHATESGLEEGREEMGGDGRRVRKTAPPFEAKTGMRPT